MKADLAQLDGVDVKLGGIVQRASNSSNGEASITMRIYCADDLRISIHVDFEVVISRDGNSKVIIQSPEAYLLVESYSTFEDGVCVVRVPWMKSRSGIPVWFHTIRRMLRKSELEPWTPSVLVAQEFRTFPEQYSANSSVRSSRPVAESQSLSLFFGSFNDRGRRNYNEDVRVLTDNVVIDAGRSIAIYGVLDGHGGVECAQFVDEELRGSLVQFIRSGYSIPESLYRAFREVDQQFMNSYRNSTAGSTANIAVYDKSTGRMYIANTGDARAVLSRDALAFDLSYDRKASDAEEIARITQAGGFVMNNRVMGSLAVSRAFGDNSIKAPIADVLVVDPEITVLDLCPTGVSYNNEFVILATDGLWDVFPSQMAVDFVHQRLTAMKLLGPGSARTMSLTRDELQRQLNAVAEALVRKSIDELSSMDNVSAVIVLIRNANAMSTAHMSSQELAQEAYSGNSNIIDVPTQRTLTTSNNVDKVGTSSWESDMFVGCDGESSLSKKGESDLMRSKAAMGGFQQQQPQQQKQSKQQQQSLAMEIGSHRFKQSVSETKGTDGSSWQNHPSVWYGDREKPIASGQERLANYGTGSKDGASIEHIGQLLRTGRDELDEYDSYDYRKSVPHHSSPAVLMGKPSSIYDSGSRLRPQGVYSTGSESSGSTEKKEVNTVTKVAIVDNDDDDLFEFLKNSKNFEGGNR